MRAAPPVEIQSALRGGWWVGAAAVWLSVLGCFMSWLGWHWVGDAASAFMEELPLVLAVSLLAVGTFAAAGTLLWHARQEPMRLSWTGSHWVCMPVADAALPVSADAVPGAVDVMLDMGEAVLLRWRALPSSMSHTVWLPVSRSSQPERWHALRVALGQPTPPVLPRTEEAL